MAVENEIQKFISRWSSSEVNFVEVLEVRVDLAGFFLVVGIFFLSFSALYEKILTFVIAKLRIVMI